MTMYEGDTIEESDLHLPEATENSKNDAASVGLDPALEAKERESIVEALEKTRYNKTAAAKLLGITFRQLRYRIKKLGIE